MSEGIHSSSALRFDDLCFNRYRGAPRSFFKPSCGCFGCLLTLKALCVDQALRNSIHQNERKEAIISENDAREMRIKCLSNRYRKLSGYITFWRNRNIHDKVRDHGKLHFLMDSEPWKAINDIEVNQDDAHRCRPADRPSCL